MIEATNNKTDRIIRNLYLCSTDNREKMQQAIIENILYTLSEAMTKDQMIEFIRSEFLLEINDYEVSEALNVLKQEGVIVHSGNAYLLAEKYKDEISKNIIRNNEIEKLRNVNLRNAIKAFDPTLDDVDLNQIIDVFSEYVYECFLEYGRNAIRFFLPNNVISVNGNLYQSKIPLCDTDKRKNAFTYLCNNYANHLSSSDLMYLEGLAIKAENFFALGVPKEDLEKAQEFNIKDLIILVDTNFIYSIMGLHIHPQDQACKAIVKIIKDGLIDCKLKFIPKTAVELKKHKFDFERAITTETLSYNQMRALVESEEITQVAKDYFSNKMVDPNYPHPSEKIEQSNNILKASAITIYNHKFPHLEDQKYINAKFEDYYDFHNLINEARVMAGLPEKELKHDDKIEHDIYLREAIIALRREKNKPDNIDYVCLTLDNSLIKFDNYVIGKSLILGQDTPAPNFILPTYFLRRVRSYLPVVTEDYRKAFIVSMTANTYDITTQEKSSAAQRSLTYFKNLGIEDTELISAIIKKELFFKNFSASEKENSSELFLRSEADKEYERLKKERVDLQRKLQTGERDHSAIIEKERRRNHELESQLSMLSAERADFVNMAELQKQNISTKTITIEKQKRLSEIGAKKATLVEKQKSLRILQPIKDRLDAKADDFVDRVKCIVISVIIVFWIASFIVEFCSETKWVSIGLWVTSAIITICPLLFVVVKEKEWSALVILQQSRKKAKDRRYRHDAFSIQYYDKLNRDIVSLTNDISTLGTSYQDCFGEQVPNE